MPSVSDFVLSTRLSLTSLLFAAISGRLKGTVYYFDLYARSQDATTVRLAQLVGVERCADIIERLGRAIGLKLSRVPHSDQVEDYHPLMIQARAAVTRYLSAYYAEGGGVDETPLPDGVLDRECMTAWHLQRIAYDQLPYLMENIAVLKRGAPRSIEIWVEKGEFPDQLMQLIAAGEGVRFVTRKGVGRLVALAEILPLLLWNVVFNFVRALPRPTGGAPRTTMKKLAVEFVDPRIRTGRPTHPNYVLAGGVPEENLIAYYHGSQKRRVGRENFVLPAKAQVVSLDRLRVSFGDLWIVYKGYSKLVRSLLSARKSSYYWRFEIESLQLFLGLSTLFRCHHVGVHIFNLVPDGRSGVRYMSGVVTGTCRRFDVQSMSYQSRVNYNFDCINFFNVFDAYLAWGRAWIDGNVYPNFIKRIEVIGNVYADACAHDDAKNEREAPGRDDREGGRESPCERVLMVFTSDIITVYPSENTLKTAVNLLTTCLSAVARAQVVSSEVRYVVFLKPKEPKHTDLLLEHPDVKAAVARSGIEINLFARAKFDEVDAIRMADVVLASAFTTPGIEPLSMGKPSAYFTPYSGIYRPVFDADNGLVLHTEEEVVQFLLNPRMPADDVLDGVDPYRDGKASERLAEYCMECLRRQDSESQIS